MDTTASDFPSRLRHVVVLNGGTSALAKAIARSEGGVRKWLRGESEPNVTDLRSIAAATGAKLQWLVTGEGENGLPAPGVREESAIYKTMQEAPLDCELLERVMELVEQAALTHGSSITSHKRSAMTVILYEIFLASGKIDRSAVTRMLKLAA